MTTETFLLRVGKKVVEVKPHWIVRWDFINDIYNDLGSRSTEWTYSPYSELKGWVRLNEDMDDYHGNPVPLSTIWQTIQFMNPSDPSYLLYSEIDPLLSDSVRERLLGELGAFIRRRGERPEYHDYEYSGAAGLYYHFYLERDPAYGIYTMTRPTGPGNIKLDEMRPDIQELILSIPLDIISGIMQQTWQRSVGHKRDREDSWMEEIPWYYVNWRDVALFAPNRTRSFEVIDGGLINLVRLDDENRAFWDREEEGRVPDNTNRQSLPLASMTPVQRYYHERNQRLESVGDDVRVYRHRMPNELPYKLAGLVAPLVDETSGHSLWLENSVGHVRLTVSKGGKVTPQIPRFSDFWDAMVVYMSLPSERVRVPYGEPDWDGFGLYDLIGSTEMRNPYKVAKNKLHELNYALLLMNVCLFCDGRVERQIDSMEYPSICRRIGATLGTKTLEAYANYLLLMSEDTSSYKEDLLAGAGRARVLRFVEDALEAVGEEETTGFITLPTITPEEAVQVGRKPKTT